MEITLIKLLLAHLVGDFFLQPSTWVNEKEIKKLKSGKLYLHIALHTALIFLVFFSFEVWKIALIIGLLHGIIDATKLHFQKEKTKRYWFFIDQFLHVIVIIGCWLYYEHPNIDLTFLKQTQIWLFLVGALFLTTPAAIFIRIIITKWIPQEQGSTNLQLLYKMRGSLLAY